MVQDFPPSTVGIGLRISDLGLRVLDLRFRVYDLGFRVEDSKFSAQGLGSKAVTPRHKFEAQSSNT